jgi:hypothetical protein
VPTDDGVAHRAIGASSFSCVDGIGPTTANRWNGTRISEIMRNSRQP